MENEAKARIHAIYNLVLERYLQDDKIIGICSIFKSLFKDSIITEKERMEVERHFRMSKPSKSQYQEFFYSPDFNEYGWGYWWIMQRNWEPETEKERKFIRRTERQYRIDFLATLIYETK